MWTASASGVVHAISYRGLGNNWLPDIVTSGSMPIALLVAFAAGLISFLSPCVLPLVPGYLSYMTGVAGARAQSRKDSVTRSRTLWGTLAFIAGFSTVFISYGALFGGLGHALLSHQRLIQQVMGVVIIVMGLGFLGVIPAFQREIRIHRIPSGTLLGAFALGAVFAIGWTPCIGPTLSAVQGLAISEGSAVRGAILSAAYCLGLGFPFIVVGLLMERGVRALKFLRKHSRQVMYVGGVLLIVIGLLLVTGYWNTWTINLRVWATQWGAGSI
jgi:cytochrome c-type biogenesis protein